MGGKQSSLKTHIPWPYPQRVDLVGLAVRMKLELAIFFHFFKLICFKNWSIVDLHYCVNFRVQRSDSVTQAYTFFFIFFSIMVDPRKLNIAQLAILLRHSRWCQRKWFWGHTLRNPTGLQAVPLWLCLQGTRYCREWQSPFEYSNILSHHQSETSVLIYPKSKKRLMGISFSTIILKNKSFSRSGNIDWRDYSVGLVWSRSTVGVTAWCFGVLGNPLAAGWR